MANERKVMGEGYIWNIKAMMSQKSVDTRTAFFDPYFLEGFWEVLSKDTRKNFS